MRLTLNLGDYFSPFWSCAYRYVEWNSLTDFSTASPSPPGEGWDFPFRGCKPLLLVFINLDTAPDNTPHHADNDNWEDKPNRKSLSLSSGG